MTLREAELAAERLWWMMYVEAESYAMSTLHDGAGVAAIEVVAEVRATLRDKFGVNLDDVGVAAREGFDAALEKKLKAKDKMRAVELFHMHLDACERCEKQPFALCPKGQALLEGTTAKR